MQQIFGLSLENYKSFYNKAGITIRPLTLFYGYNSAGKSAALRFLSLLADSTNGSSMSPLNLRSEILKGADFESLLSKHSSSPRMSIQLSFGDTTITISIRNLTDLGKQVVERFEVFQSHSESPAVFEWLPEDESLNHMLQAYTYADSSTDPGKVIGLAFNGLVPIEYPEEFKGLLDPVAAFLISFGQRFVSLSADCLIPDRYEVEIAPAKTVSRRGEGMMSMLQAAPSKVIKDISEWYEAATGYSFHRTRITIGDRSGHRFTLHPNADEKIDIDIADTGEGMGQVLPVVGLLTLAKYGNFGSSPIISLEHPELHIHPDAHVHLANLFCDAAVSNSAPRILVETHSENLLLGIQLAIANKRIKPSDVAVHWVRGTAEGAIVELVEFDDEARPLENNWPVDVFRTNSKLARELFEKRRTLDK
jgi:predicted ATPase